MANVKLFFSKEGKRSRSRSHVQKLWYHRKGLVIRKTHAKSPISYGKKLYIMLKFADGRTDRQSDYYRAPA